MAVAPGKTPAPATTPGAAPSAWTAPFFARIIKSRTLAATLIAEGKFRVNKDKVEKASVTIKLGDVVTSTAHRDVRVLRVAAIGKRRGPAAEAQTLSRIRHRLRHYPKRGCASGVEVARAARRSDRRLIDKIRGR